MKTYQTVERTISNSGGSLELKATAARSLGERAGITGLSFWMEKMRYFE